jgi:hypothetical protein
MSDLIRANIPWASCTPCDNPNLSDGLGSVRPSLYLLDSEYILNDFEDEIWTKPLIELPFNAFPDTLSYPDEKIPSLICLNNEPSRA